MDRTPKNEYVIIQLIKPEEKKTVGGIILPQIEKKRGSLDKGQVHLADPNVDLWQGNIVYFRPNAGQTIELDDKEYIALPAREIALVER